MFSGDARGAPLPWSAASADFNQDGWGIDRAIDGEEATAWGIYPQVGKSHLAVFELKQKLKVAADAKITVVLKQLHGGGHLIGRARLAVTDAGTHVGLDAGLDVLPVEISAILAKASVSRTTAERQTLARFQQRQAVLHDLAALPAPSLVYAAAHEFEPDGGHLPPHGLRPVEVLYRGDIRQPRGPAVPGTLSCVPGLASRFKLADSEDEGARRWLTGSPRRAIRLRGGRS